MECLPQVQQCRCIERQCLESGKTETIIDNVDGEAYSTWDIHFESPSPFDFGLKTPREPLQGLTTPRAQLHLEQTLYKRLDKIPSNGTAEKEDIGFHEVMEPDQPKIGNKNLKRVVSIDDSSMPLNRPSDHSAELTRTSEGSVDTGSSAPIITNIASGLVDRASNNSGHSTDSRSSRTTPRQPKLMKRRSSSNDWKHVQSVGTMATAYTIRTLDSHGRVTGLDLEPYTQTFDQHFNVDSQKIHYILDPVYRDRVEIAVAKKTMRGASTDFEVEDTSQSLDRSVDEEAAIAASIVLPECCEKNSEKKSTLGGSAALGAQSGTPEGVATYSASCKLTTVYGQPSRKTAKAGTDESTPSSRGRRHKTEKGLHFLRSSTARNQEMQTLEDARMRFEEFKTDPGYWGLSVSLLWSMWMFVEEDLTNYSNAHYVDKEFNHICLVHPCRWHHNTDKSILRSSDVPVEFQAGNCKMMEPNMHLVVNRYVKPWTEDFEDAGLALVFNAGSVSDHKQVPLSQSCKPSVFISHCWNERFDLFTKTLKESLDPSTIVWVCSFAIWQHGDVEKQLGHLEECPFARALQASQRVLLVTDVSAEAVTRCWCVLEAELARKWGKDYDMCLNDDFDFDLWGTVGTQIEEIDLEQCHASIETDKEAILEYARSNVQNGIQGLNKQVKDIAKAAKERARLMAAAAMGDVTTILQADQEELGNLRSVRGRSLIHIAASCGRVAVIMMLRRQLGIDSLDLRDEEGNSPLCVAAADGALCSVQALLAQAADVNEHSCDDFNTALTPLHFAAAHGHSTITLVLVHAEADVESQAKFQGVFGRRPLHVAARLGHKEVVGMLVRHNADFHACAKNGMTVLFHAVSGRHTDALASLLALAADANQPNGDAYKKTPLMGAVSRNSPAMVSILLEAAADPSLTDGKGQTCLQYMSALSTHDTSQIKTLIEGSMRGKRSNSKPCTCASM